jgi:hypothetical protein
MVATLTLRVGNASSVALTIVTRHVSNCNMRDARGGVKYLMKSCHDTLHDGGKTEKRKREVHEQNVKIQKLCRRSDLKKTAL